MLKSYAARLMTGLFLLGMSPVSWANPVATFGELTASSMNAFEEQDQVTLANVTDADHAGVQVAYGGAEPKSVPLLRVPLEGIDGGLLTYSAALRAEKTRGAAYLEMWCEFPDGARYFSRALDEAHLGKTGWQQNDTPFFLESGQRPAHAVLGVRFEGPGVLVIADVELNHDSRGSLNDGIPWDRTVGIAGGIFGTLAGIWGGIGGWLAGRGKGKRVVLAGHLLWCVAGCIALAAGIVTLVLGYPRPLWYGLLLLGGIATVVFGWAIVITQRRFLALEHERLNALDRADSI